MAVFQGLITSSTLKRTTGVTVTSWWWRYGLLSCLSLYILYVFAVCFYAAPLWQVLCAYYSESFVCVLCKVIALCKVIVSSEYLNKTTAHYVHVMLIAVSLVALTLCILYCTLYRVHFVGVKIQGAYSSSTTAQTRACQSTVMHKVHFVYRPTC